MTYTKLIERLRKAARHDSVFGDDVREHASEQAADAIEALQGECAEHKENAIRNARIAVSIRAERDALQAKLDAMGKGEPVAWSITVGDEFKNCVELTHNEADAEGRLSQLSQGGFGSLYTLHKLYAAPKALAPLTDEVAADFYATHSLLDSDDSKIVRNAADGYPEGREPKELALSERVKALCAYAADWKRWCEEAKGGTDRSNGLAWAVSRWHDEVSNRPLVNKNRRPLDDAWRQVISYFGGNPDQLCGPSHDELVAAHGIGGTPKALAPHEDAKLLDYLQERQATVEILIDGHGLSTPLFRIGGLHGTICADIRGAIGAAANLGKKPDQHRCISKEDGGVR